LNITQLVTVRLAEIALGNRSRTNYGNIDELAADIKDLGLIQPIAIFDSLAPWIEDKSKSYTLIAGGRRMLACLKNGMTDIPVRIYTGEITEHRLKTLELSENLKRKNFTFVEECELKRQIHELQVATFGEKKASKPKGTPEQDGWSKRDTAQMLGESAGGTAQDIMLAEAMEKIPELKKAKNKKEALIALNKMNEDLITQELQRRIEAGEVKVQDDSTMKKEILDSFIITDTMQQFKEPQLQGIADIVICDPPYAIDLASVKLEDQTVDLKVKGPEEYKEYMKPIIQGCYDILKTDSWLILWFGIQWIGETKELCKEVGFDLGPVPFGYWAKNNGRTMFPDRYLANRVDSFMYMRKGEATIEKVGHNVFAYPVTTSTRFHKTEKPVALEKDILYTFARTEQMLVVPFLGSGNTLIAAKQLGMSAFGFEIEKKFKSRFMYNLYVEGILDLNDDEASKLEKEVGDKEDDKESKD